MPTFARLTGALLFCLCNLLTIHGVAAAQEQTMIAQSGVSPTGSYQPGGIDTINLQNGGVVLSIPILSYPQVGSKLKFSFSLHFSPTPWFYAVSSLGTDSSTQTIHYTGTWHNTDPAVNSSIGSPIGVTFTRDQDIYVTYEQLSYPCKLPSGFCGGFAEPQGNTGVTATFAELYSLVTADGGVHNFGIEGVEGSPGATFVPTLDGTNFAPINGPFGGFIGPDGVKYTPLGASPGQNASSYTQSDPDGNVITYGPSGWADTLGRHIAASPTGPGVPANGTSQCSAASAAQSVVAPAPNGGSATYTLCYANQTAATSFSTPYQPNTLDYLITTEQGGGTQLLINQLVLPNGTSYSFTYDNYLNLTSVTLPTGGKITYGWQTAQWNDITHQQSRVIHTRTVTNTDGSTSTWTYTITPFVVGETSASTVITDPAKNDEEHIFGFGSGTYAGDASETINYYNGTGSSRSLLKTTVLYRAPLGSPIRLPSQDGSQPYVAGPIVASITTWAATNQVSQTLYTLTPGSGTVTYVDYNQNSAGPQGYTEQTCESCFSTLQTQTEQDYDYGNGQPGPLLRQINTQYQWQEVPSYLSANLLTIPASVKTLNGAGTQMAETDYSYDESAYVAKSGTLTGSLTSMSNWLNTGSPVVSHTFYNSSGMPTRTLDPKGNATNTTYQCSGAFPSQVVNALNQTSGYAYDCLAGLLTGVQDPNDFGTGTAIHYSYDSSKNMIGATFPDGGSTTKNYNNYAVPLTVSSTTAASPDPSLVSSVVYDGLGQPVTSTAPSGAMTTTTYDGLGRVTSVSNPHTATPNPTDGTTFYSYDALGRPLVQTQQDGSSIQKWSYSGNVTTFTDEAGHAWQRTSDALGRLTQVMEPTGAQTVYTYDALNNLLSINQKGISGEAARNRSFTYDSLSRLLTSTNPETGTICYGQLSSGTCVNGYDANGNLLFKTDARGIVTSYLYDALNRMTAKSSAGASGVPGFNYSYLYDDTTHTNGIGRLTHSSNDVNGAEDYFYDPIGRLDKETYCIPDDCSYGTQVGATYDLAGNQTSLTYPDGRTVSQQWNSAGQLTQVSDVSGQYQYLTPKTTYWPNGIPSAVFYGNGVGNGTYLNNRLQTDEIGIVRVGSAAPGSYPGNNNLAVKEYCYGPATSAISAELPGCPAKGSANNGNIWQVMDVLHSGYTENLSYDSLSRLGSFSRVDGSLSQTYAYDSFGNLNQTSPGTLQNAVSYGANNRINSASYGYDNAGNLTASFNGISTAYSYDAENMLTGVNNGAATYTYDANGDRVRKDNSSTWTEYVRFGGQVVAEKTSDGFWSDYIYANGKRIAKVDNNDIRIHMSGTNCSGCGIINTFAGTSSLAAFVNGTVIQNGDLLTWRQFQDGVAAGGISVAFNNDSVGTAGTLRAADGQLADADPRTGQWYQRVADLSSFAGDTVSALTLYNYQGGPAGNWDIYLADISLVHPDGTSVPIYYRSLEQLPQFTPGGAESNVSVVTEKVAVTPNPYDVTYYSTNQIGSSILLTDSAGWPVSSDTYYPFGQEPTPSADGNHYKFTGQERDSESGLDYFGARYYGSSTGRFMSPDPSGLYYADPSNPQSFNLYAYVQNNPLVNVDPNGLDCIYTSNPTSNSVTVETVSGDCRSDGDDGVYVNGTVDTDSYKYTQSNGNYSLNYTYTPDGDSNGNSQPSTLGVGTIGLDSNPPSPENFNIQQLAQGITADSQHSFSCIAGAYGIGAPSATTGRAASNLFNASQNLIGKARFGGALGGSTSYTSEAAMAARASSWGSIPFRVPTPVGTPFTGNFAMRSSSTLGGAAGRYAPYAGAAGKALGAAGVAYSSYKLWNCLGG